MKIAEYVGNNIVIVEPHGRLTMETIQYFRRAIARRIDQGWSRLILDLQNVLAKVLTEHGVTLHANRKLRKLIKA